MAVPWSWSSARVASSGGQRSSQASTRPCQRAQALDIERRGIPVAVARARRARRRPARVSNGATSSRTGRGGRAVAATPAARSAAPHVDVSPTVGIAEGAWGGTPGWPRDRPGAALNRTSARRLTPAPSSTLVQRPPSLGVSGRPRSSPSPRGRLWALHTAAEDAAAE